MASARRTGSAGVLTSRTASGGRCARTIPPTATRWDYFPHDAARCRAYRWGEDGLLGITDRECRLCFALALWNGSDPILKERLFGLTGPEGNHGEDVKELYYYLDATPTHSYLKALYKYPQRAFPYDRSHRGEPAAGHGAAGVRACSTPASSTAIATSTCASSTRRPRPDDLLMRITVVNRGPEPAPLHVLPTLWFRNTWAWGRTSEGYWPRPELLCDDRYALAPSTPRWGCSASSAGPRVRRPAARAPVHRQRDQRASGSSACRTPSR